MLLSSAFRHRTPTARTVPHPLPGHELSLNRAAIGA
jgi:hypothetical protein